MLVCEDLHKDYIVGNETVRALDGVSVRVERGEFLSVMGPSGSGKSTFMNMVGCLDTPTRGRIVVDGETVSELSRDALAEVRNRKIGFVFQQFHLLGRTSALDNVELPLLYAGVPRPERVVRAEQALERVGLRDRMGHVPAQLSGGQQQRVAIARALVNRPVVLLADEPTGALDSATGVEIMELFQELNEGGITVLVVTHEPEVAGYARRVLRFRDGRVIADERQPARMTA
ncbi:MAG: ABC transporter ATP-binding protein [Gammaproteobacteria bacterium]|nr:ABC transporter ATP-binding protein [Gammaproteobacteria bacterium]